MKTTKLFVATVAGMLSLGTAGPATAADTPVSLLLVGGTLAITVPILSVGLGTLANTVGGSTISGSLGVVQVLDARSPAAGSGWIVSVISTALTPASGPAIAASAIGYTAGTIVKVGTATYTANNPANIAASTAAVTATAITGDNSATWTPTINVAVPGGTAAGTYTGTITHSVV